MTSYWNKPQFVSTGCIKSCHLDGQFPVQPVLTHWGRVTHICVGKLTIIGSNNGLSPRRWQAIIWTNAGILLIRTLGTTFSEILTKIHIFSFKKVHFKMSSAKWQPFCPGLNVLKIHIAKMTFPFQYLYDTIWYTLNLLTHWGRVTQICVSKLAIIGSDNGLSPGRCQAIIWTNDGILLIGPFGTNLNEILTEIYTFSLKKMHLKMSSGK